ncbi:protein of unknown function DUF323 [Desulfatibacillum aliphaticivorans]|uniref:Sulfatase-modifying factor enzyme-like domain-containing protein n=1 Tax=Desulfatibacillum aliphaticivorans TaxID=218208 RepID=B8FJP8_DESAL|nr:SUMF1/EgtB/PvdO family nonheme iron enzyme [Desulfatibacillum aliphaticivorans]ACL02326.1 protein of unknown function DUF323 [Desulfatibacillum aliphaticivorans]
MDANISREIIEKAVDELAYRNKKALKYLLLDSILRRYPEDPSLPLDEKISADDLIREVWDTGGDPQAIANRRKNFNSIKSAINSDLKRLYKEGKNPSGVIIGPENNFIMSDEAREALLATLAQTAGNGSLSALDQLAQMMNTLKQILSDEDIIDSNNPDDALSQIHRLLRGISEKLGIDQEVEDAREGVAVRQAEEGEDAELIASPEADGAGKGGDAEAAGKALLGDGGVSDEDVEIVEEEWDDEEDVELIEDDEELEGLDEENVEELEDEIIEDELVEDSEDIEEVDSREGEGASEEEGEAGNEGAAEEDIDGESLEFVELDEDVELIDEETLEEEESEDLEDDGGIVEDLEDIGKDGAGEKGDGPEKEDGDGLGEGETGDEDLEIVELDQDEELVGEETLGEEETGDEDLEIVELDQDEELEVEDVEEGEEEEGEEVGEPDADLKLEELDDDVEIIDADALEYEDFEEAPEAIEGDDDYEIVELDDDEELVDMEDLKEEAALDDDVEVVDAPEDDFEEIDEPEDDAAIVEDEIDEDVEELEDDLENVEVMDDEEELEEVEEVEEVEEALSDEEGEPTEGDGFGDGDLEEEDEEEYEEVGLLDDDEELEILDDDMELEEVEEAPKQGSVEPTMGALGADDSLEVEEDKARVLAEQFDGFLGSMEKAYNQYLLIPEGRYVVGCKSPGKGDRPRQKIDMPPFYMGKFPVTNALFEIFVEKTGYITTAEEKGYSMVYKSRFERITDPRTGKTHVRYNQSRSCEKVEGANWYQPLGPGSTLYRKRNHPVVQVSRRDAIAFAAWTGKKLPGEDEWEAAARTQKGLIYPWGSEWEEGRANTEEARIGDTCPVEHLSNTNALNISGMAGNILEWTADLADSDKSEFFVVKGSSWISSPPAPLYARTFCKGSETSNILGFRCVAI